MTTFCFNLHENEVFVVAAGRLEDKNGKKICIEFIFHDVAELFCATISYSFFSSTLRVVDEVE